MKVSNNAIQAIEEALGFELYEWQKAYLLDEPFEKPTGRAVGRTTAYIVKLLLSEGERIDIRDPQNIQRYQDYPGLNYKHFFRKELKHIDDKLTDAGFRTRTYKLKTIKRCSRLSMEQINLLEIMLSNNKKYNMPICSCDINRVLEIKPLT